MSPGRSAVKNGLYAYVQFEKPDERVGVHLRRIDSEPKLTLCGLDISGYGFWRSGGTWLDGAPDPDCADCVLAVPA